MSKRIKILYIVSTLQRCGPTNQLFNIVSNLDEKVFDRKVLTLSSETNDTLKSKFDDAGIDVESLSLGRFSGLLFGWSRLLSKIKVFNPDLIHTQGLRADNYALRLKKMGIKTVATIRCIPNEDYPLKYGKIMGRNMAKNHLITLKGLDVVAAVSHSISLALQENSLNTVTIQNGCDINKYTPVDSATKKTLRSKLNLLKEKIVLISVGHLSNRKDPITIIRAFKHMKDNYKYELIFVGDGEMKNECRLEAGNQENIKFIGRVSNVDEYLQSSDVFLSASLSEGLPNSVLESLSSGIPTILSSIPQHTEIFNGYPAYDKSFFPVGDSEALTLLLNNFNLEFYKNLPTRSIVENNFNALKMSMKYQEIYKKLLHIL